MEVIIKLGCYRLELNRSATHLKQILHLFVPQSARKPPFFIFSRKPREDRPAIAGASQTTPGTGSAAQSISTIRKDHKGHKDRDFYRS
jgi:hypothetical protein